MTKGRTQTFGQLITADGRLGALGGDAIESFFKRRVGIKAGNPWFFFDQVDYIIGGLLFGSIVFVPPVEVLICTVALFFLLHLVVSYVGFLFGFKDKPI